VKEYEVFIPLYTKLRAFLGAGAFLVQSQWPFRPSKAKRLLRELKPKRRGGSKLTCATGLGCEESFHWPSR
jgi:hypothetical protein